MRKLSSYLQSESGASAAEYALILALIGLVITLSVSTLGHNVNSVFSRSATSI